MSLSLTQCNEHRQSNMNDNADTPGYLRRTSATCEGKKDGNNLCNRFVPDEPIEGFSLAAPASDGCEQSTGVQSVAFADNQDNYQSLFLSQEASSIFDMAMEMHAAPTNDPPMWGDNPEDFREVADMLEDMEDFSAGNEAVGQSDCDYPPSFKAAYVSKGGSFSCFLGDAGASSSHGYLDTEPHSDQSYLGNNDVRSKINDCALKNDESPLPLPIMNMDERIFEDNIIGDIGQAECDSITDAFFYNRGALVYGPDNSALNSKLGPPDTTMRLTDNFRELKDPPGDAPLTKEANLGNLHQTAVASLTNVAPGMHYEGIIGLAQCAPMLSVIAPLTQLNALPEGSMLGVRSCNSETEIDVNKHKTEHHTRVTSKSDAAWERRFLELEEFKRQHGHCNVHQKCEKNPSLGAWVARQRLLMRHWEEHPEANEKRTGKITNRNPLPTVERIKRLKNIGLESSIGKGGFGKSCSRNTNEWEKQFSGLIKYRVNHGNCNVPTKTTSLGRWVASQRKKYRTFLAGEGECRGKDFGWNKELLNRFQRLKEVGFNFHVGKGNAQSRKSTFTKTIN